MMSQRWQMESWLGEDHGLTDDQVTALMATDDAIYARYCTPDEGVDDPEMVEFDLAQASEAEREEALRVAYRLLVEDPDKVVAELGRAWAAANRAQEQAKAALVQAAHSLVSDEHNRGVRSQGGFARIARVDRMSVLEWLGRRRRKVAGS